MRIRDSIAERLEACGLYRRAASRWIEVMQRCLDDEDREWIRHHRNQCLKRRNVRRRRKRSLPTSTGGERDSISYGHCEALWRSIQAARQRENGRRVMPFFTTFA